MLLETIDCEYLNPKFAAAYLLISGREAAFIETNTAHAVPKMLQALKTMNSTLNRSDTSSSRMCIWIIPLAHQLLFAAALERLSWPIPAPPNT